ncbi:MAG: 4-diphosphocytidyl-2-C-methyl-D-erythritol kinase [Phycisphaerae bacterium]|nr:4-diphosphocytidyl-2-C-methyl-D-erythritol kinase [Phycisphaerae bacterium]
MSSFPGDRQVVIAPAKINLTLRVLGKRSDGYHELDSVVCKVDWQDTIVVAGGAAAKIELRCTRPDIPTDGRNLLWKVTQRLGQRKSPSEAIVIELHKEIPVGAGLGGGSSDAAALLLLLNQRWQLGLTVAERQAEAAAVGSDVPLFLVPGTVRIGGRGERVEPFRLAFRGVLLLVKPTFAISTAAVYAAWSSPGEAIPTPPLENMKQCTSAAALNGLLFNDLETSIYQVEPRLRALKHQLEELTGQRFHVTGSGSTLFTCCEDPSAAGPLVQRVRALPVEQVRVARILDP